jgi:uncharacterized protein (DUF2147 family)
MMQTLASAAARVLVAAAIATIAGVADVPAAAAQSPIGHWMTEGGDSHVAIYRCGGALCGRIIWLRHPRGPDGLPRKDLKNPVASLRARRVLGLRTMWGFVKGDDPGEWKDGRLYDPANGETYKCSLTLRRDGKLAVSPYVGVSLLSNTKYWQRVR